MASLCHQRKNIAITLMGLVLVGFPTGTGLAFLYRASARTDLPEWARLADLEELPRDGQPQYRLVSIPTSDAWQKLPNRPVGAVFVRYERESKRLHVLRASIAYGLRVEYSPETKEYADCCWGGRYDLQGKPLGATAGEAMQEVGVQRRRDGVYIRLVDVIDYEE